MQNNKSLYEFDHPVSDEQILEAAAYIIAQKQFRHGALTCPKDSEEYLRHKLALIEHEVFAVLFLDSQNRILEYKELFRGTINAASAYPREVVKEVLKLNAASVILAHNHPSGVSTPSQADKLITTKLQQALNLIDVSIVDHIIKGKPVIHSLSMAIKIEQVLGLNVPESLFNVIVNAITKQGVSIGNARELTLNFRDKDYSAAAGGFHPVEIKLEKPATSWQLVYITDFSYQGRLDSELVKEIDVCFVIKRVYHMLVSWLSEREGKELLALFVTNFVEYYNTGCYQVTITTE